MLCWILHGYFPCSFSSHPRLHPSHQLVGCVVLTYCVQNKCPFKKFKLPECNLVLLTDIWPERKISHRINKVDQDRVKQVEEDDDFEGRVERDEILILLKWQSDRLCLPTKTCLKPLKNSFFLCHGHF